jgi:hypothetical protein
MSRNSPLDQPRLDGGTNDSSPQWAVCPKTMRHRGDALRTHGQDPSKPSEERLYQAHRMPESGRSQPPVRSTALLDLRPRLHKELDGHWQAKKGIEATRSHAIPIGSIANGNEQINVTPRSRCAMREGAERKDRLNAGTAPRRLVC